MARINTPLTAVCSSSRPAGSFIRKAAAPASMMVPDSVYRAETSRNGGNDSSAMRIPR